MSLPSRGSGLGSVPEGSAAAGARGGSFRGVRQMSVIPEPPPAAANGGTEEGSSRSGGGGDSFGSKVRKMSMIFTSDKGRKLSGVWSHKKAGKGFDHRALLVAQSY